MCCTARVREEAWHRPQPKSSSQTCPSQPAQASMCTILAMNEASHKAKGERVEAFISFFLAEHPADRLMLIIRNSAATESIIRAYISRFVVPIWSWDCICILAPDLGLTQCSVMQICRLRGYPYFMMPFAAGLPVMMLTRG